MSSILCSKLSALYTFKLQVFNFKTAENGHPNFKDFLYSYFEASEDTITKFNSQAFLAWV